MTTALAARGLTRRFGTTTAVDALDLDVREGEILGFLGPNGAGKTTSIRMMSGLLRPTSGHVEVYGRAVGPDAPEARRLIGLCPQENVVYQELTARENLEYVAALYDVPRRERRERADRLLADLGLAEKATTLASKLSGGMRRRLTLGLAIVHDPAVVVLDEPEAGLDPQTRVAVRDFVRDLGKRKTVVLTSHNMDEVERLADRVAILDHGKLVALGTPDELKARAGGADRLEVRIASGDVAKAAEAARTHGEVVIEGAVVVVAGQDLARRLPQVLASVERVAEVADVRYRGVTLEDVFIQLTGRALRE